MMRLIWFVLSLNGVFYNEVKWKCDGLDSTLHNINTFAKIKYNIIYFWLKSGIIVFKDFANK